jgi:MoaA/NifB/PqqE/SkfB family radical SAM enzyme
MGYSVGIGLTNACNLSCAHCYRDTDHIDFISLEQIKRLCAALPVDSLGMGTGENAFNPEFIPIVQYLRERGVRLSVASNGYTLTSIPTEVLQAFHDVEVSIDFPAQARQDAFRGEGNWALVHAAIERCRDLGVEVSILTTLMSINYSDMQAMVALARQNQVNLRVNVYQAVKSTAYRLSYTQFWEGYRQLFAAGQVVSCSEPVVRAVMGLGEVNSPCGQRSIRFTPQGQATPCVYWPLDGHPTPRIEDLAGLGEQVFESVAFRAARQTPPAAATCPCQGGCASRRALNQRLDAHDDYCPWARAETIPLPWQPAPHKDLMRSGNVCTTIVV